MTRFITYDRNKMKDCLTKKRHDLLVIGGGITGAGVLLDAASRGLKAALVDMQDFAAGTSSRSTKLIHGGLRYLKQFEFKLVAEVGKERALVYENGPHVTQPEWLLLPIYKGGTLGPLSTRIGLRLYDRLAQVKKTERHRMLNVKATLEKAPLLLKDGLLGAGYYSEYKTDDARLVIEVLKKAVELGAVACNYVKAVGFVHRDGKVIGVKVEDELTNEAYTIYAKKIVNAAGPWVDAIRELDGFREKKRLFLTKGVHLVFDQRRFPLTQAVYFDAQDGRMIFAIPRDGKTYVGTTDTPYSESLRHPETTHEDAAYLLKAINHIFPTLRLTEADVESSWAGLRPLVHEAGKNPGEISRKDEIFTSPTGLISIAGGKLTGYRKMSEKIVDIITNQLEKEEGILYQRSKTATLPISGGDVGGAANFRNYVERKTALGVRMGLSAGTATYLAEKYGSNVDLMHRFYQNALNEKTKLAPVLLAELMYAIECEAALKPTDFFVRRTGMLYFDIASVIELKDAVIKFMAEKLNWTEDERRKNETELDAEIGRAKLKDVT